MNNWPTTVQAKKPHLFFTGGGFQAVMFVAGEGEHWDIEFPDCDIRELPYFSLFPSGGITAESEADGIRYMADRDHPWGVTLDGKEHWNRKKGRARMWFKNDTQRLCVYPVNALGEQSFEPITFTHYKGPCELDVPGNALTVKHGPQGIAFYVSDGKPWKLLEGEYGVVAWKL